MVCAFNRGVGGGVSKSGVREARRKPSTGGICRRAVLALD